MKLTQRDRIMLSVLVIALSLFCGIWFVIRPAFKDVQKSKEEYNTLRSDYNKKLEQVEAAKDVKNQVGDMYEECVDLASQFYDFGLSFDISESVYGIISESDITVTSLSVSQSAKQLRAYSYNGGKVIKVPLDEYIHINGEEEVADTSATLPSQSVGCYSFNIGFTNMTREKIFAFVENIKMKEQKTLIVTNLSFNVAKADSVEGFNGNLSLEFYYMTPPDKPIIED